MRGSSVEAIARHHRHHHRWLWTRPRCFLVLEGPKSAFLSAVACMLMCEHICPIRHELQPAGMAFGRLGIERCHPVEADFNWGNFIPNANRCHCRKSTRNTVEECQAKPDSILCETSEKSWSPLKNSKSFKQLALGKASRFGSQKIVPKTDPHSESGSSRPGI